jgi:hypothetical protein
MMRGAALLLCSSMAMAGCNSAPVEPVTVTKARDNIHTWNGRIITVQGWLGNCQGYDCGIYPTLPEAKSVMSDDPHSSQWQSAMNRRLSIGTAYDFDEKAAPLQFQQVSIQAVLSDVCRGWDRGCTDRAPDLVPLSIVVLHPAKKAN